MASTSHKWIICLYRLTIGSRGFLCYSGHLGHCIPLHSLSRQCRILLIYTVYLTFIILNHNLKSINHFFSFLKSISFGHARFTLDSDNSHYYCGNFRIFHTQFHMIVGLLQLTLKIHTNVSTVAMPKNHVVCCQWWVVKNTATYFTGICHNLLGPYFYHGYNSSL